MKANIPLSAPTGNNSNGILHETVFELEYSVEMNLHSEQITSVHLSIVINNTLCMKRSTC